MRSTPPRSPRAGIAPRAAHPRRPLPRRPWQHGRLLIVVLTLALVATLGTRALADDGNSGSLDQAPGPQTEQLQPQAATSQQLAAVDPGSTDGNHSTVIDGDTPQGSSGGQPKPPVVAQGQGQAEHPDPADQDQRPNSSPIGCASDCAAAPTDRRDPIVAAVPPQEPQPPQQGQPRSPPPSIEDIKRDLRSVREVQAQRAEEGREMGYRERDAETARLGRAREGIQQLEAQVAEGTLDVDPDQLADLRRTWDEAHWQFGVDHDLLRGGLERYVHERLRDAERDLNELRARAEGRQTDYPRNRTPAPQVWLDGARHELEQERPLVEAEADSTKLARLAELEHWLGDVQRRLDYENPMSVVNLDTRTPGYSQVEDQQAPRLPGFTASAQVPQLPGTTPTKVPGLPGTTPTKLDNSPLQAQATLQQQASKARPWTDAAFDAEFQRVINAGSFAGALWAGAVLAPSALGALLKLKPSR